jgi:hypothetical protein
MSNLIDIEAAKAFRNMGVPYDTPVEKRFYSRKSSKRLLALARAQSKFLNQAIACSEDPTERGYAALDRLLTKIDRLGEALMDQMEALQKKGDAPRLLPLARS